MIDITIKKNKDGYEMSFEYEGHKFVGKGIENKKDGLQIGKDTLANYLVEKEHGVSWLPDKSVAENIAEHRKHHKDINFNIIEL